jgi:hypothetical protein
LSGGGVPPPAWRCGGGAGWSSGPTAWRIGPADADVGAAVDGDADAGAAADADGDASPAADAAAERGDAAKRLFRAPAP